MAIQAATGAAAPGAEQGQAVRSMRNSLIFVNFCKDIFVSFALEDTSASRTAFLLVIAANMLSKWWSSSESVGSP